MPCKVVFHEGEEEWTTPLSGMAVGEPCVVVGVQEGYATDLIGSLVVRSSAQAVFIGRNLCCSIVNAYTVRPLRVGEVIKLVGVAE